MRPGLDKSEALRLFANAGVNPDPSLIALYTWHDGAEGGGPPAELMDTARFLSLQEAIDSRMFELGLAAENESLPDLPAAEIFDPSWFPILTDASGRVFVVDHAGAGRVMIVDRMAIGAHEELGKTLVAFIDSMWRDRLEFKPPPLSADPAELVARLESSNEKDRMSATRELTRKRPVAAFDPLVAMLESDMAQARRNAALILGLLGDRRAIPILIRCIARWDSPDATSAYSGLRDVNEEGALVHLENALANGDVELRLDAIRALTYSRDGRAVPAVHNAATHDPDAGVRAAAEEALRALGEPQ